MPVIKGEGYDHCLQSTSVRTLIWASLHPWNVFSLGMWNVFSFFSLLMEVLLGYLRILGISRHLFYCVLWINRTPSKALKVCGVTQYALIQCWSLIL